MATGDFAALDRMIASARALAILHKDGLPAAAREVERQLKMTASAGQSPAGVTWVTKKDGGRALVNAAAAISTIAIGTSIVIILTGKEVFHHFGAGVPLRQVIPVGSIPAKLGNAIRLGFVEPFRQLVKK